MRRRKQSARKTVDFFPNIERSEAVSSQQMMFVQDLSDWVIPYGRHTGNADYKISISGRDAESDRVRSLLESISERDGGSTREIVEQVVRSVAGKLAWMGLVRFEIYPEGELLLLGEIPSHGLYALGRMFVQVVPKSEPDRGWQLSWVRAGSVWTISMPRALGGVRRYRTLLKKLRRGDAVAPSFWSPETMAATGVDIMAFNAMRERFIAALTRKLGWNWRNSSQRGITEFYYFYRTLTFSRTQAILREYIVEQLNLLFVRLAIDAQIAVLGIPKPEEIDQVIRDVVSGKTSFADAYKTTSLHR